MSKSRCGRRGKGNRLTHKNETPQRAGKQGEQRLLTNSAVPDVGETPPGPHALGLRLITELSVCVQQVSSDLAQAHDADDLALVRQRWAQQLRTLAALVEGQYVSLPPSELPLSALPPYPRRNASTQSITVATRIPVASSDDQVLPSAQEMPINPPLPASYRWVPLTAREREVLKWTQRGYPPRRIAPRLVVSVETVYTHMRNIRRKQREWEQARLEQQAKQAR